MKKFLWFALLLCTVFALAACSAAQESSAPSSSPPQAEAAADAVTVCQDFLQKNDLSAIKTIRNWDAPEVTSLQKLPDSYCKIADSPGRAPYTKVTFSTDADGLLGPIEFYIDDTGALIGQSFRE